MNELLNEIGLYVSWQESGHTATAMITDYNYFDLACNLWRDGAMGEIDADGYCSRNWGGDTIAGESSEYEGGLRPATWFEVKKYLEKTRFDSIQPYEPSPYDLLGNPLKSPYKLVSGLFYDRKRNRFYGMKIQAL